MPNGTGHEKELRFPNDTHRHSIVGMTGSGKTVFGLWCLSRRSFDQKPWIILDFKRDPTIGAIPHTEEIGIAEKIPKRPGLYVTRPDPKDVDEGAVTSFFYRLWQRENTGLFVDESYMLKRYDQGLRAVLTQGRSKHIPVIALSQKPSWISPFVFSESEYKSIFYLQMPADIDRVCEWLPRLDQNGERVNPEQLADHHSYWYGVPGREFRKFGPCPNEAEVLDVFDRRRVKRVWL